MTSICPTPDCPNPAPCPTHTRPPWRKGSSSRKQTLPTNWPKIRATVLQRDGHRCQCPGCPNCHQHPCTRTATSVDHINHPHDHTTTNLRALCWGPGSCHAHRSSHQGHNR